MHKTVEVIKDIRKLCTHEFEGGHRCASPALRGETYCYFYHPTRKPVRAFPSYREAHRARRAAFAPFALTPPTTRPELQLCLNEVLRRLAAGQIHPRRAGRLLSALQIVCQTLPPFDLTSHPPSSAKLPSATT